MFLEEKLQIHALILAIQRLLSSHPLHELHLYHYTRARSLQGPELYNNCKIAIVSYL